MWWWGGEGVLHYNLLTIQIVSTSSIAVTVVKTKLKEGKTLVNNTTKHSPRYQEDFLLFDRSVKKLFRVPRMLDIENVALREAK
jgi:hypothetical protein